MFPLPQLDLSFDRPSEILEDGAVVKLLANYNPSIDGWKFPPVAEDPAWQHRKVGPRGVLYSFSTVHVSALRKVPYMLGYVDFPEGLRVLAEVRANGDVEGDFKSRVPKVPCGELVVLRAGNESWWVEPVLRDGMFDGATP